MKIEKTYKQVIEFDIIASNYIERIKQENQGVKLEPTPIEKCIELMFKQTRKIISEFNEKRDFIRMEHCIKDEKTRRIVMENKDYTFTEPGLISVKEKIKKLEQESVTIHQRILPENNEMQLTALEKEIFSGFVIDEKIDPFEAQFKDDE